MPLKPKQQQIFNLLDQNDGGVGLSFRKIGEMLGGIHHQTVANTIKKLIQLGHLRENTTTGAYDTFIQPVIESVSLPVYGSAQCGNHGTQIINEYPNEKMTVSTKMLNITNPEGYFFMRAVGKSMEPEIHEGDLLLIRQQTAYQPNDKVLIIHETKPKIKLIKETPNGHFLISLNQSFDDVLIQKDHNTQIVGIVKKIIGNF